MKSLFIVRTPFQLFNCIEAKSDFLDIGDCYLLCIYKKNIDKAMMENLINKTMWKEIYFFKLTTFNKLFYPSILGVFLRKLNHAQYCFFGLTTPMISHCINVVSAEKNILIDDGNEIFLIAQKIANGSIFSIKKFQKWYNILLGRKIHFEYVKKIIIFSFFDLKNYKLGNTIIHNDYRAFKQKILNLPRSKEVFFIGSNLIDTYMDKGFFENNMQKIINYYQDLKLTYILHRYEDNEYLQNLGERFGFKVIRFSTILEAALLEYGCIPYKIATFRSTALETLGYLYEPIEMEIFKIDVKRLLKAEQEEEYLNLYKNYEQKKIVMIDLKVQDEKSHTIE